MRFYASLTGPLRGYYLELPAEINSTVKGRAAMLSSQFGRELWCEVYTEEVVDAMIDDYGGAKLPILPGGMLNYDYHAVMWSHVEPDRIPAR